MSVEFARPLLAGDDDAEALFRAALRGRVAGWPAYRARLLLEFGCWLRRRRRVAESRHPLRSAREAFDALGMTPWAERARTELRASGEGSGPAATPVWTLMSPQELQIAQLAATGLSNREIGQKLFLSHRTVGSHLYRIFPKLGITARSQLRDLFGEG
jgi:DNA-binding CsgD family transcriptional regulator